MSNKYTANTGLRVSLAEFIKWPADKRLAFVQEYLPTAPKFIRERLEAA